ncbi:MAG: hypothetical protein WCD28_09005, partial [Nitrososphaeraceae archaeon]
YRCAETYQQACGVNGANSFATRSLWQPLKNKETEESLYFFYSVYGLVEYLADYSNYSSDFTPARSSR